MEGLNNGTDLGFFETLVGKTKNDIMDCYIEIMDFEKQGGLIPTIVQDVQAKEVLMLAYSSKESLKKTYEIKKATYYSRSRKTLWTKGVVCHRNKKTCFTI